MLTKEFHDEAVLVRPVSRFETVAQPDIETDRATRATVVSLLVRLLLNGWITDKEKVFLDNLPPDDCLAFLIRDGSYVHPEGLELFPPEVVESASKQAGEAIFSHRYRPELVTDDGQHYRIFSAAINPADSEKIVLGFFGPEHRLGSFDEDNRFAQLTYLFREVYGKVSGEIDNLNTYLDRDEATILINRTSGRVLTLNRAASQLLSRSERVMVDISLDQFRYHLLPLLSDYNLKMDNITASDLGISVVTFETDGSETQGEPGIVSNFMNRFISSASSLEAAVDELTQLAIPLEEGGVLEAADRVKKESERINATLSQFNFVLNFDSLPHSRQSLELEVKKAVSELPSQLVNKRPVTVITDETQAVIEAPAEAFRLFVTDLLTAHLTLSKEGSETNVMMHSPNSTEYSIRVESPHKGDDDAANMTGTSSTFTRQMASRLGIDLGKCLATEGNRLVTELTVKH